MKGKHKVFHSNKEHVLMWRSLSVWKIHDISKIIPVVWLNMKMIFWQSERFTVLSLLSFSLFPADSNYVNLNHVACRWSLT